MAIILIIIGVVMVAASDWMQPNALRKPKLNFYLSSLGGIVWLAGVVLSFVDYKLLHAVLLLIGSFVLGAILRVRKS